jgi:hypothetical protein
MGEKIQNYYNRHLTGDGFRSVPGADYAFEAGPAAAMMTARGE